MTIKTRLIILASCALLFLVFAPYTVLYSLGYRIDFATMKLRATGGIYVYAVPEPSSILIDSKPAQKTGLFSSAVFMQNMIPGWHSVLIKREGYYDYQKNLQVQEKEVAKLENVVLFKQKINFTTLGENVDYVSTSTDNRTLLLAMASAKKIYFEILNLEDEEKQVIQLPIINGKITDVVWAENANAVVLKIFQNYYLLNAALAKPTITMLPSLNGASQVNVNPQNSEELFFIKGKNLYSNLKTLPIVKNVITYNINSANITWLSYDGFLYEKNSPDADPNKISSQALAIKPNASYQIKMFGGMIFMKENDTLFLLDKNLKTFQLFQNNVKDLKHSPDNQKIIMIGGRQILISSLEKNWKDTRVLATFAEPIKNLEWLNSSYIIVNYQDSITISEVDTRGNVNMVTMTNPIPIEDKNIIVKNPKIFFNQQTKKLYILSEGNLLVSEKLIP